MPATDSVQGKYDDIISSYSLQGAAAAPTYEQEQNHIHLESQTQINQASMNSPMIIEKTREGSVPVIFLYR